MKPKILFILSLFIVTLSLTACQNKTKDSPVSNNPTPKDPVQEEPTLLETEKILNNMSLEEKVGQLFIIRPDALDSSLTPKQINDSRKYGVKTVNSRMTDTLSKYPVGGIVMFSKNITNPTALTKYIQKLQSDSQIPLFMGIDEEGGAVSRIANNPQFHVAKYKNMTVIGNTKNTNKAKDVGKTIGTYLKKYGFNLDFAPDADVNTNPDNPIIGTRAFGSDPKLVGQMVGAAIEGFHSVDMMSSTKHFPGHGDTQTDTHLGYAATKKTWKQMLECEMIPFKQGIKAKTDMVMVSHITAINVTTDKLPSSLSYEMITQRLRQELEYDGIVITDSLSMEAITKQYNSKEAAVKALQAGVDILLMPEDYKQAYEGIMEAIHDETLDEARIDQSVLKILKLKQQYKLLN